MGRGLFHCGLASVFRFPPRDGPGCSPVIEGTSASARALPPEIRIERCSGGGPMGRWEEDESSYPPASVLVVDDRPANLIAVEAVLGPLGHRIVLARSGREAL